MPIGFEYHEVDLASPASQWAAVTPSDTVDLATPCRALYVGVGGDVAVRSASGQTETFRNVGSGQHLLLRAARVMATGTTASGLVALW
ncbi:hypothetical protein ACFFMP_08390 [Pseudoroseomonas cervicalis]|uniref:Uncharacterized protein n=1 Tax=Pseudoroseomonas cervicalis ATCC 49957 TaxID=525371 RepID=D5RTE2_9PROT|nr:hypothetical protein [Pseudoroseomonas cervicalis]EFH09434.1 hypothetical protein HMPREF0731_4354 [Pseudoroseomonas cervicalis ATCC 49957]